MKKLALALLLFASAVRAEPYLSAKNEGGGEIVLMGPCTTVAGPI